MRNLHLTTRSEIEKAYFEKWCQRHGVGFDVVIAEERTWTFKVCFQDADCRPSRLLGTGSTVREFGFRPRATSVIPRAAATVRASRCSRSGVAHRRKSGSAHFGWKRIVPNMLPRTVDSAAENGARLDSSAAQNLPCPAGQKFRSSHGGYR